MRYFLVAVMVFLVGCSVPPEVIRPQYIGQDAAVLKIYCGPQPGYDYYLEIDHEVFAVIVRNGVTMVKAQPGDRIVVARSVDARIQVMPIKIRLEPGEIYHLRVELDFFGPLMTRRIEKDEFQRLVENKPKVLLD
jgi:hypothetical protein